MSFGAEDPLDFLVVGRDNFIFFEHEVVPLGARVEGSSGTVLDPTPLLLGWSFADHGFLLAILPPGAFFALALAVALKNSIDRKPGR